MTMRKSVLGGAINIVGAVLAFIGTICFTFFSVGVPLSTVFFVGFFAAGLAVYAAVNSFKDIIVGGVYSASACMALIVLSVSLGFWAVLVIPAIVALAAGSALTFAISKEYE